MIDPRTNEVFSEVKTMNAEEVAGVVAASHKAFEHWRNVDGAERCRTLKGLAEKLRERAEEGAALMNKEMGKPVSQGIGEVNKCAMLVDWYAEHAPAALAPEPYPTLPGFKKSFVSYQPIGVILSVMPWNFPFWQAVRMAVPTMVAGNSVVLKHASNCMGSALMLEDIISTVAPKDLFRAVPVGSQLVAGILENPLVRGAACTGSEAAGIAVATKCASMLKKCVVELGGSDPYCVLADADIDVAAQAVINGRMLNTGQVCIAPKRVIVEKGVKEALEKKIVELLPEKKYGQDFGPLSDAAARQEVHDQVQRSIKTGAKVLMGGDGQPVPDGDSGKAYYPPTVLTDVKPGSVAWKEEIFGPVIAITEAKDEAEALRMANDSEFGLGGAVFTKDLEKGERIAAEEIDAGMVFVNDFVRSDPSLPFGGTKMSGLGRECSILALREFCNIKTICVK